MFTFILHFVSKQVKVDIYEVPKRIHMKIADVRGMNDIPTESVCAGYLFEPDPTADVSFVFGPPKDGVAFCLLARFHNTPGDHFMSDEKLMHLFNATLKKCKNGGFERKRMGGSSGLARWDRHLMDCLTVPNIFPRDPQKVMMIPMGNKWECLYISPFETVLKDVDGLTRVDRWNEEHPNAQCNDDHPFYPAKCDYSPPVLGGQLKMDADFVEEFPFLYWFAESKIITAHMLRYLCMYGTVEYNVVHEACNTEYEHLAIATADYYMGKLPSQCSHPSLTRRQHILIGVMQCNTFTMVTHPVGYHRDTFRRDGFTRSSPNSLENKTTFLHPRFQHSIGRGGNHDKFTWSLLDW